MKLTEPQASLLRSLALFKHQGIKTTEQRVALDFLERHSFAEHVGPNGTGQIVAIVTEFGICKALADRLIPKHPDHPMPAAEMLAAMRRER